MAIKQMDAEARRRTEELHVRLGKIFDSAEHQSVDEQMIQEIERTLADVVEEAVRTQREVYPMTGEARLTDDAYLHTRINGVRVKILLDIKQARRRALDIIRKYEHQFDGVTWAPLEQDIEQAMATAVAQAVAERDAALKDCEHWAADYRELQAVRAQQAEEIARLSAQVIVLGDQSKSLHDEYQEEITRLRGALREALAERDAEITKLKAVLMLHGHVA